MQENAPPNGLDSHFGKWLLFAKRGEEHDLLWKKLCRLYSDGVLSGVWKLKSSTAMAQENEGIIYVYCGPYTEEKKLMDCAMNLVI